MIGREVKGNGYGSGAWGRGAATSTGGYRTLLDPTSPNKNFSKCSTNG